MSKNPIQPSAFPHQHRASDSKIVEQYSDYGLTMRDYFAGQALQGYFASSSAFVNSGESVAKTCFEYADAMMKARNA